MLLNEATIDRRQGNDSIPLCIAAEIAYFMIKHVSCLSTFVVLPNFRQRRVQTAAMESHNRNEVQVQMAASNHKFIAVAKKHQNTQNTQRTSSHINEARLKETKLSSNLMLFTLWEIWVIIVIRVHSSSDIITLAHTYAYIKTNIIAISIIVYVHVYKFCLKPAAN